MIVMGTLLPSNRRKAVVFQAIGSLMTAMAALLFANINADATSENAIYNLECPAAWAVASAQAASAG